MKTDTVLFKPSNATEGDAWRSSWCECCKKHDFKNDDGPHCQILGDMLAFEVEDKNYPTELCFKDGQPICTAFHSKTDNTSVPYRCNTTLDMFKDL